MEALYGFTEPLTFQRASHIHLPHIFNRHPCLWAINWCTTALFAFTPHNPSPHTTYRGTGRHPSLLIFPWRRMEKLNLCAHTLAFIQNILIVGIKIPLSKIHKTFKVFEKMTLGIKMQMEKNWLVLLLVLGQMKR